MDVCVIILTYNEEANLSHALSSVCEWASQLIVVDSFSTDRTVEIARGFGCEVVQHEFEDHSKQRNFALLLPIAAEWVLFLDADETVPSPLQSEISSVVESRPFENGYYIKWRLIWMGKWIKHGYYPTWILRLVRAGKARCEERAINEHLIVDGEVGYLKNDFIHEDRKPLNDWLAKQSTYARKEAMKSFQTEYAPAEIRPRLGGSQAERKRWVRINIWNRLPPLLRPFLYFGFRYVIRGGFRDGREAFVFHFLQGLWLQMLIDIHYLELRRSNALASSKPAMATPKPER